MAQDFFAVQVFFIVFRECLEAAIILSVLLSFLKQWLGVDDRDPALRRRLVRQVWAGVGAGLFVCLVFGGAVIGLFCGAGRDIWSQSEHLWEGIFYLIACLIITAMGFALLRVNKMRDKWYARLGRTMAAERAAAAAMGGSNDDNDTDGSHVNDHPPPVWSSRYAMFLLPFVTTLREGVEAVVFVGGVSLSLPATAFPLPVACGLVAAATVGWLLYRGGGALSLQVFLVACTSLLYLMAAGMFSKSVWLLQYHQFASRVGGDVAESGSGPGSYDVRQAVWHVNCCNPETDRGWDVFNAILGWQNTGTYGSVISYNLYWVAIMAVVACLLYEERHGQPPFRLPALRLLVRVPGLRGWAGKKMAGTPRAADAPREVSGNEDVEPEPRPSRQQRQQRQSDGR